MNDTKKHTAAPNKHPPKPNNLSSKHHQSHQLSNGQYALRTDPTAKARHTPPPHSTARSTATGHIPLPQHCRTSRMGLTLPLHCRFGAASRCYSLVPSGIGRGLCGRTVRSRALRAFLLAVFVSVYGEGRMKRWYRARRRRMRRW